MRAASFDSFDATPEPVTLTLSFGKHRGEPLSRVPADYLEWVRTADRVKYNRELLAAIEAEIASRTRGPAVIDKHTIPSRYDELTLDLARLIVEAGNRELRECFGIDVRYGQAVEFLKQTIDREPIDNGTLIF